MKPIRIQRKRTKGFNLQDQSRAINGLAAVSVCRPGYWGNPYKVGGIDNLTGERITTPEQAVLLYRKRCLPPLIQAHARKMLRGKNLACWCALNDKPCHADVLLEIANQ